MSRMSVALAAVSGVLAAGMVPLPADGARAQQSPATPAWKLYETPESCTISLLKGDSFVLLTINPEGGQGLRMHHPDLAIANNVVHPVSLTLGERQLAFDVRGAVTADGTPGFIVAGRRDLREAFGAAASAKVELSPAPALSLDLAGLAEVLPQLDACTAGLTPRDPESIVAVTPRMTKPPRIDPGELPLEGATRRDVSWRVTISPEGKVADCEIVRSSGSAALDDQVCRLLRTTSRFEPGRNAAGKPVTATFQSRVVF